MPVTLQDVMNGPHWPKCERCQQRPMAYAFFIKKPVNFPAYGIPPWCSDCLEQIPWEEYFFAQAQQEYRAGVHAVKILNNLFGSRKYS